MPPGPMIEQDPVMLTGSDGTFYSGDQVIFARNDSIRAIRFDGSNTLDVAIDVGLVEVTVKSSVRTSGGLTTAPQLHEVVILTFKAGKWKDWVTTPPMMRSGIERVTYDHEPNKTWYIYSGTELQLTENDKVNVVVAIGADVSKFLTDLRDEVTARNSEMRKTFVTNVQTYVEQNVSSLEHFAAVGNVGRFLASLIEWGKGASSEDVAYICSDKS